MSGLAARIRLVPASQGGYTVKLFETAFPADGDQPVAAGSCADADLGVGGTDPPFDTLLRQWRDPAGASANPQAIGERLYHALHRAGIADAWSALAAQASAVRPFRTFMEVRGDASRLPWELLAVPDPEQEFADFVSFRAHGLLVRAHTAPVGDCTSKCVRVLIVTGSSVLIPAAQPKPAVTSEPEIAAIVRAFQPCDWSVHIEALRRPGSRGELLGAIADVRPHILHFIGHGGVSPRAGAAELALLFDGWAWEAQDIRTDLAKQDFLRLVYLNACHSAPAANASAAAARAFMRVGSAAVIAMQAAVTVESAFELTRAFYSSLADGAPLDAALRAARESVRGLSRAGGLMGRDWGLPVLSVAAPPEQILTFSKYGELIRKCAVHRELMVTKGPFVNRGAERRTVLRSFQPFEPAAQPERGLLIRGSNENNGESGKSWLAMRCLFEFAHVGHEVRRCDLAGGTDEVGYRDVLKRLRHGWPHGPESPMYAPMPADAFAAFDAVMEGLDEKIRDKSEKAVSAAEIDEVFDAFKAGLATLGTRSGLVFVLDTFTKVGCGGLSPDDFRNKIVPKLLTPILIGELEGVRFILVMRESELAPYGVCDAQGQLQLKLAEQPVAPFATESSRQLFDEFCRFAQGVTFDALYEVFKKVYVQDGPRWSPLALSNMAQVVRDALKQHH
jgi:hypothetical protein